jgi:hypothetical protein
MNQIFLKQAREIEQESKTPISWMMELLRHMSGVILSEIYGGALFMMHSQQLIVMPDWMPEQYQHSGHNFETGMDRMRFIAPALIAALGSDPENTMRVSCRTNGIPAHLRPI